jgi:hypothetical protein
MERAVNETKKQCLSAQPNAPALAGFLVLSPQGSYRSCAGFLRGVGVREEGVAYPLRCEALGATSLELFLTAWVIEMRRQEREAPWCVISDRPREGNRTATPYENNSIPDQLP